MFIIDVRPPTVKKEYDLTKCRKAVAKAYRHAAKAWKGNCKDCGHPLTGHGSYLRITPWQFYNMKIWRVECGRCGKTHALIPCFIIPYGRFLASKFEIVVRIGRLVLSLKRAGYYKETVLIVTSDHGDFLGDYDLIGKQYFYEPSIRIPLILSSAQFGSNIQVTKAVSLTDLFATILKIADVQMAASQIGDSLPLPERDDEEFREHVFGVNHLGVMVTNNEWKYCWYRSGETMLFRLSADSHEKHNLINETRCSKIVVRLQKILIQELVESLNYSSKSRGLPEYTY